MGRYLDILDRAGICDISDQSDKSPPFGRLNRFCRTFSALETRCPELVPVDRWQARRRGRPALPRPLGRAGRGARLDRHGSVRPPQAAGDAAPELQPPVSIRRDRTDLAAAGPAGRRADRGDRRDPELDRRPHDLPQAQQARARPSRRQPRRPRAAVRRERRTKATLMLDHSCQAQRHAHAERGHDLYETPSVAVEALMRVLAIAERRDLGARLRPRRNRQCPACTWSPRRMQRSD